MNSHEKKVLRLFFKEYKNKNCNSYPKHNKKEWIDCIQSKLDNYTINAPIVKNDILKFRALLIIYKILKGYDYV